MAEKFMIEKSGVENFGVGKLVLTLGLKSYFWLWGKLSGVEMSCNHFDVGSKVLQILSAEQCVNQTQKLFSFIQKITNL